MTTLMTINTIELSSLCDLSCRYCINRMIDTKTARKRRIMREDIFELTLDRIRELVEQGTQQEINLNGNGESCLDPDLPSRAARVIAIAQGRQVSFCTNGKSMTAELARDLRDAGIRRVDLSTHDAYYARRAADILTAYGIMGVVNGGAIIAPHNWAGQLEEEHSVRRLPKIQCDPLIEGRGYVQAEGYVSPCCYDFRHLGTFGGVWEEDLLEKEIRAFDLCRTCHQTLPKEVTWK